MYENQDVHTFMDQVTQQLAKHSACDVLATVKRVAAATLEPMPQIIIRESAGKRPYGCVVIELTGPSGSLGVYFQDAVVEFRQ